MKKKMNYTKEFKVKACELVLKDEVKVKTVISHSRKLQEKLLSILNYITIQ